MMSLPTTFAVLIALFALFTTTIISLSVSAAETTTVYNWYIPYTGPKTLDAKVGETIAFEWDSGHNVYIHPTMDCDTNGAIFVGSDSPALYTFTEADAGTDMYFACEIGGGSHCNSGQNLIVTVSAAGDDGTAAPVEEEPTPSTIADILMGSGSSGSSGTSFILSYSKIAAAALLAVLVAL